MFTPISMRKHATIPPVLLKSEKQHLHFKQIPKMTIVRIYKQFINENPKLNLKS